MNSIKIISIAKYSSVVTGILALLSVSIEKAEGHQSKRTKKVSSHQHTQKHDHGGHEHSKWSFGAGVSIAKGLGSGAASDGGGGESGDGHTGHTHLTAADDGYSLAEGDTHDGGGGETGGGSSSGVEPTFSTSVGYRITDNIGTNLGLSFGTSSGIGDPLVGMDFRLPKLGTVSSSVIPSFTIPVSKASADSYKITTFSTTWNPSKKSGKITYSASAGLAKSYYSKTVIVEEEAEFKNPARKSLNLVQEDHNHDDEGIHEEGEELDTGDREFDRYSVNTSAGYSLSKNFLAGVGLGVAMVTKQFGPSQIETNATILKGTYLWNSVATTLALGLSESQESFAAPKNPNVSLGLFYIFE